MRLALFGFHCPNEICEVNSDGVVGGAFSIIERAGDEMIEPAAYGCDVTLTQTGVLPDEILHAWRHKLESLALMCAEPS